MSRNRKYVVRFGGLFLILAIFGFKFGQSLAYYGHPYTGNPFGLYVALAAMGLLSLLYLWMASAFRYADQVAIAMIVELFAGMALHMVTDHVSWWTVMYYGLFVTGGCVLAFGHGKSDEELPITKWRARSERRALPRINRRREKQGKQPVASFKEHMDEIPASKLRRRRILTWVTMPIVFLSVQSMFRDLGRQGNADSVATEPLGGLAAAAVVVFAFFVAAWWFSDFKYRSTVLGLEVLMGVALLVAPREGWKTTISPWDVASDVALLVLACAQMRDSTDGRQQPAVRSSAVDSG